MSVNIITTLKRFTYHLFWALVIFTLSTACIAPLPEADAFYDEYGVSKVIGWSYLQSMCACGISSQTE